MKLVAAAIIQKNGRILIARRGADEPLAGKWEFPGGKIEPGESPEECLVRELKEELDLTVVVGGFFAENTYIYSTGTFRLLTYFAESDSYNMRLRAHDDIAWVEPSRLSEYDFFPADRPIIEKLAAYEKHL